MDPRIGSSCRAPSYTEVQTSEATLVDDPIGSATLNGYFVVPQGSSVTTFYQYGPCPLGSASVTNTTTSVTTASGVDEYANSVVLTSLAANTYCYR